MNFHILFSVDSKELSMQAKKGRSYHSETFQRDSSMYTKL